MMQVVRRFKIEGNYIPAPPIRSFRPISCMTFKKGGGHSLHVIGCGDEISQAEREQQISAINRALDAPAHEDIASFADMCAEFERAFGGHNNFPRHAQTVSRASAAGNGEVGA